MRPRTNFWLVGVTTRNIYIMRAVMERPILKGFVLAGDVLGNCIISYFSWFSGSASRIPPNYVPCLKICIASSFLDRRDPHFDFEHLSALCNMGPWVFCMNIWVPHANRWKTCQMMAAVPCGDDSGDVAIVTSTQLMSRYHPPPPSMIFWICCSVVSALPPQRNESKRGRNNSRVHLFGHSDKKASHTLTKHKIISFA
jgi:hypothetical protein